MMKKIVYEGRKAMKTVTIRGKEFQAAHLDVPFELRNPILQLDHYIMDTPIFPPHKHAGCAAVSYIFDNSEGSIANRTSLELGGNTIRPGDIHYTLSNKGMVHEEYPLKAKKPVHGLQILVNIPESEKSKKPRMMTVESNLLPVCEEEKGVRVKVVAGTFRKTSAPKNEKLPIDFTLLDCKMEKGSKFNVEIDSGRTTWLYVVDGKGTVVGEKKKIPVSNFSSVGFSDTKGSITLESIENLHVIIGHSKPIKEPGIWGGETMGFPGVFLKDRKAIEECKKFYEAGGFGKLDVLDHKQFEKAA